MDWSRVNSQHIEAAIDKYIKEKPEHTEPIAYYLIYKGEKLPAKYIRAIAYSIATGEEINLDGFSGGMDTVKFFEKFGYTVENIYDDSTYIKIISKPVHRTWLLTWNPKSFDWTDYKECCTRTREGKIEPGNWTCSSKQPAVGDDVFLMKTGLKPRGVMAHGIVTEESYEEEHYDPEKAEQGLKSRYIGVDFDRIQDYEKENILVQDDLKARFPEQMWSPMGSGIEIKPDIATKLAVMWNAMINVEYDKNIILYGPPGTGKTYSTAIYAVAICDGLKIEDLKSMDYDDVMLRYNELVSMSRIAFTTFHQSYGYEEFIEGIKPAVDEETGNISYDVEPGVFKKFCESADVPELVPEEMKANPNAKIWFVRLASDGITENKERCFRNGELRFDLPKHRGQENSKWFTGNFIDKMQIGDYVLSYSDSSVNIDAVGVIESEAVYDEKEENGKWSRKTRWYVLPEKVNVKGINSNTYLPNFYIARMNHMKTADLLRLIPFQKTHADSRKKPYVFIIDEINRGNISKIFGELITLIEDTKRKGMEEEAGAILPYSGEKFSVPENVYILGTMNTADRSIALMDTALRRRFQFVEMMPDSDVLREIGADKVEDLDVAEMLDKINERISFLYDREHTIGHAFFTKLAQNPTVEVLKSIFEKSVIPLLQEYFYEDYQKIQLVLGDNAKSDPATKFILDEEVKVKSIFKGNADDVIDLPEKKYSINKAAFYNIESYKQII